MTEPQTEADPFYAPITAKQAKTDLLWAWFQAHPNQPMPEGRKRVEHLVIAIEAPLLARIAELEAAAKRLSDVAADHYSSDPSGAVRWAAAVNAFDAVRLRSLLTPTQENPR